MVNSPFCNCHGILKIIESHKIKALPNHEDFVNCKILQDSVDIPSNNIIWWVGP